MSDVTRYVLIIRCPDQRGIVASVSGYLNDNDITIIESSQFHDAQGDMFFVRLVFRQAGPAMPTIAVLGDGFQPIAHRFGMEWDIFDLSHKLRTVIAVSKFGHCLNALLYRWRSGLLPIHIVGVISNHDDLRREVEREDLPFFHLPVTGQDRSRQESEFLLKLESFEADLVILARYMQILSDDMVAQLDGRCINIHHSFLPSFKGAKPYHQAYERGVKIIGATAHYVTSALDECPIIEQDVERVHHGHTPESLIAIGQEIEMRVLTRAVTWHAEHRVIISHGKTVVFA